MTIEVHGPAGLTSTGLVLITLFEKDVEDFEVINVDMMNLEHRTPEYLKMQPFGRIPYIVDGDFDTLRPLLHDVTETSARYIAHKFADQGTALYGQTPKDHALTEQWLDVEAQNYNGPVNDIVYNLCFAHLWGLKCDDALVTAKMAEIEAVLDVYEKRLSETQYLAGHFFSLADLSHITFTYYMINTAHKGAIYDSRPHVKAWVDKLLSRPSSQKWLKLAGIAK